MKKKINIDRIKLTPFERRIEAEIERGEWVPSSPKLQEEIREALMARRKDSVLNIRLNSMDLKLLKKKAKKLGVKYQTFIAEILHRVAHS